MLSNVMTRGTTTAKLERLGEVLDYKIAVCKDSVDGNLAAENQQLKHKIAKLEAKLALTHFSKENQMLNATNIINKTNEVVSKASPERNEVIFVIDRSASMTRCWNTAVEKLKDCVKTIGEETSKLGQTSAVSVLAFTSRRFDWVCVGSSPETAINQLATANWGMMNGTPLNDAIGNATDLASERERGAHAVLFIVITDGYENESTKWDYNGIANVIGRKQGTGKYSFAFMCPVGSKDNICRNYGVPAGNVLEWENSIEGTQEMGGTTLSSVRDYYSLTRSKGATSTDKFITVTTNLAPVSEDELRNRLSRVTDVYKEHELQQEELVKDFVEKRTKRNYTLGEAYYQLMKTERVSRAKDMIVKVKTGPDAGTLYTGPTVRAVLGLQEGNIRVKPGNHSNYDIFVQSLSVNRILPRGTRLLIKK